MATSNFAYDNRCIVVTNDDFEMDNLPPMGKWLNNDFNYPSRILAISDDFDFWDIVMTSGYYEAACIDYIESERDVEDFLGSTCYFDTKEEFFKECKNEFGLSDYRMRKICGNMGKMPLEDHLEQSYERLTNYLPEQQETNANKSPDNIKHLYGYEEYVLDWRASNGEAGYRKIG